jgi:hypothetical protein
VFSDICVSLTADYASRSPGSVQWSIDANSAWTPTVALEFLPIIADLARDCPALTVFMLEQPFPADFLVVVSGDCFARAVFVLCASGCVLTAVCCV